MLRDIYILYKKGELRCFFDNDFWNVKTARDECFVLFLSFCEGLLCFNYLWGFVLSSADYRQTLWSSAKRSLKPSRFFETLKTSAFDWNYLIAPNFICELNKNGAFLVFVLSTLWGCQTCTGSRGLELPCCS